MVYVKEWFINKNFNQNERYGISVADRSYIERETEKAVLVRWETEFGNITSWIPKSCLLTEEEMEKEQKERLERFVKGAEMHEELVNFAKENGLKVRKNSKTINIIHMIKNANLFDQLTEEQQKYCNKKLSYI